MTRFLRKTHLWVALLAFSLLTIAVPRQAAAQDDQDDPPTRVARLGYMEGSVSFQPAGEDDWVDAVDNRPMTTGDKLWADQDSRAELQLGSAVIRLSQNTGVSFLNLDDHTIQLQLSSGAINVRVRRLDRDDDFEIDTPNLAFTLSQPGNYRLEASEDGTYTVVTVRAGDGEATGNGQTYSIHAGQRAEFSGTQSLNADIEQIGDPDPFDSWADQREARWQHSRSVEYVSPDLVGFDDLDDSGDWADNGEYGHVWFPRVEAGWAPYHTGHWAWIDPWGYTWVDDSPWGYAPFHYGRWAFVGNRWGWIPGPRAEAPIYAPALVVFVGAGGGWGGNIGWFPLGPREVFVPTYPVSRTYMTQVNVSSTTVNVTQVTNVYNTTIINKTTNITNVTYVNRGVQGAVTAVPQNAFASAQSVSRAAVRVTPQQIQSAPITARVAVNPTPQAVLGGKASTAGHVKAPPAAVMTRAVVAKATPPPPPVPFAKQQQAMAAHPGQPLPKRELASLRPAAAARPAVKIAPPGKPAMPTTGHPVAQPNPARPGQPTNNQPMNRPGNPPPNQPNRPGAAPPENRPAANQPNRPEPNRPPANQPAAQPNRPPQPENRPTPPPADNRPPANQPENRPPAAQPNRPPASQPENRPPANQPNNRPEMNRPAQPENRPPAAQPNRPEPNRPAQPENRPPAAQPSRPENNRPEPSRNEPAARPNTPPPAQQHPQTNKPAPPPKKEPNKPEEKKQEKLPGV
ncbi:MAG TPA: DUF6600 domain-containing protein [Candidatus Binatia bacterium]|nr:DUF6600 domain-containing protein [Candidatus Binatia bacterium]